MVFLLGQYSSEGHAAPDLISQKSSEAGIRHVATEASLSSVKSESRLKALMRDELLINAQKFTSQVHTFISGSGTCL